MYIGEDEFYLKIYIRNFWELISAECLRAPRDPDIARAAYKGDLAAVRGHLRRDRRCLDQLFDGRAALHLAALSDDGAAIVAFLLAQGAAVDVVSSGRGSTPLHYAASHGLTENARLLLAAKASVEIKNNGGRGPRPTSQPCWKTSFYRKTH